MEFFLKVTGQINAYRSTFNKGQQERADQTLDLVDKTQAQGTTTHLFVTKQIVVAAQR